ncbi:YbaB/EbfC family DNA-binding protein, partial [Streptomyces sp. NPDC088354]
RQVMEKFEPFTRGSEALAELPGVSIDWANIFGPGVLDGDAVVGDRPSSRRLRDEIHEDSEE